MEEAFMNNKKNQLNERTWRCSSISATQATNENWIYWDTESRSPSDALATATPDRWQRNLLKQSISIFEPN